MDPQPVIESDPQASFVPDPLSDSSRLLFKKNKKSFKPKLPKWIAFQSTLKNGLVSGVKTAKGFYWGTKITKNGILIVLKKPKHFELFKYSVARNHLITIRHRKSGKCLQPLFPKKSGSKLVLKKCCNNSFQKWKLWATHNKQFAFQNAGSGLFVDVELGLQLENYPLVHVKGSGAKCQRFNIVTYG